MDAIYYLTMLIGIAWLAVWSVLPEESPLQRWWWPFDMTTPETRPPEETTGPRRHGRAAGNRWRPARRGSETPPKARR